MSDQICMHFYVLGRVQGVWFRASTEDKARQLGITGFVRNLSDGRVEVLACGEREKITKLHTWLKQGPPLARVMDVFYEELPWRAYERFESC